MRINRTREVPGRNTLKHIVIALVAVLLPCATRGQKAIPPAPAQVAQEVRNYRMENEDRIVRELCEFLAIPNIASDTPNIQKNAAHLMEMLEARGIETHLLPVAGRGPVVFGKLISAEAKRTVIFYAHYDGQPVDAAAWRCANPFEPKIWTNGKDICDEHAEPSKGVGEKPVAHTDDWRIYARSASDDKGPIVALLAAIDALHAKRI